MSEPHGDASSNRKRVETRVQLRFVNALPDSKQAKREAKAAIRAHASRISWERYGEKSKQMTGTQMRSIDRAEVRDAVPAGFRQGVLARVVGRTPSPLLTVIGVDDVDPFTSYPTPLTKSIAITLEKQGKLRTFHVPSVAGC
jgi:hypothetical protein